LQFIDLKARQRRIRAKIEENIRSVLDHGQYILVPEIGELEKRLSEYAGVNHAISCASGTDALLMALMAYNVKPGDVIITTPFTFIATAEVISLLGARPVFADIDPKTFNIDPKKLEETVVRLPSPLRGGAKGIIAVDLFGLFVIEDAAQSFGAEYHGKKTCSLADMSCTSFFPAKPLGDFPITEDCATRIFSLPMHPYCAPQEQENIADIIGKCDTR